jgi:hypothetical protein
MEVFSGLSITDAGQILATGRDTYTGDGMTVILEPVSGPFMHEEDFTVQLRKGGTQAVARLRVLDERGAPVKRARVVAAWYDGDRLVKHGVTDRTDTFANLRRDEDTRVPTWRNAVDFLLDDLELEIGRVAKLIRAKLALRAVHQVLLRPQRHVKLGVTRGVRRDELARCVVVDFPTFAVDERDAHRETDRVKFRDRSILEHDFGRRCGRSDWLVRIGRG